MQENKKASEIYNSASFSGVFLNRLKNTEVTVYLMSGIKLSGKLLNFDGRQILIDGHGEKIEGKPQLVYTHAISTILPASIRENKISSESYNCDNFSDVFLNSLKNKKIVVYLMSGIKLSGTLLNFDGRQILIDGYGEKIEGKPQLVYTHAISTILPSSN